MSTSSQNSVGDKYNSEMSKFLRDWNKDETKRDKTVKVVDQLRDAYKDMEENNRLLAKRGENIDSIARKSETLKETSQVLKQRSKKTN